MGRAGPPDPAPLPPGNRKLQRIGPESFSNDHSFAAGVNYKHADCDGNGSVDIDVDGSVIRQNAGFSHVAGNVGGGKNIRMRFVPTSTILTATDTFTITYEISLSDTGGGTVDSVYGIAFSLDYNLPLSQDPVISFEGSALTNVAGGFITYDEANAGTGNQVNSTKNRMDIGIVSTNGSYPNWGGVVAKVKTIVVLEDIQDTENEVAGFTAMTVTPGNFVVIDSVGTAQPVSNQSSSATSTVTVLMPGASFPVEWQGFTAEEAHGNAHLQWSTSQETGLESYTVQRSTDKLHFENLAVISSKWNESGSSSYEYLDLSPAPGENYYRIHRIEEEGSTKYSEVKRVWINPQSFSYTVFPNPGSDQVEVKILAHKSRHIRMRLVSSLGIVHMQQMFALSEGLQIMPLNLKALSPGIYFLELTDGKRKQISKLYVK